MTRWRISVLLTGILVVMLAVVVLRTETTRLNYQMSKLERDIRELQQTVDGRRLELARRRSAVLLSNGDRNRDSGKTAPDGSQ